MKKGIMNIGELKSLSNAEILSNLGTLRQNERHAMVQVLIYLVEVNRRGIYREAGCSSLFTYMTEHLKYSGASAFRRNQAVKVIKNNPDVLKKLLSGEISLSSLSTIAKAVFEKPDSAKDLIEATLGKSKQEVEKIVAESSPSVESRKEQVRAKRVIVAESPAESLPLFASKKESPSEPKIELRYTINIEVDSEFMQLLEEVKLIMPHKTKGSMAEILKATLKLYQGKHSPQKRAERRETKVKVNAQNPKVKDQEPNARAIPIATRDSVFVRDQSQCSYQTTSGRRCTCRENLEVDHIVPVPRGGTSDISNLRLLCRPHNILMAEQNYGRAHMLQFRNNREAITTSAGEV